MTFKHRVTAVTAFSLALLSSVASAQTLMSGEDGVRAELFYAAQTVDNATPDDQSEIHVEEDQSEAGLMINAGWNTEFNTLLIDYSQSEFKYSDGSQEDNSVREGESSWILGNDNTFYQLTAAHSIRRIQGQAGAAATLLENSEERQITRVSPLLRARFGTADSLALSGNFSQIDFEETTANNSKREGGLLQYNRGLSSTTNLFVSAGINSVDFKESDNADYQLQSFAIGFEREQRFFDYRLSVGASEITPEEGESTSANTFNFRLLSDVAGNRFELVADKTITDTSLGNGNSEFFSDDVTFDGDLDQRDQIERTQAAFTWRYQNMCRRCDLQARLSWESSEHVNLVELDNEQTTSELQFTYQLNRQLTSMFRWQVIYTDFPDPDATQENATRDVQEFELDYRINDTVALSFFYENDQRETDMLGNTGVATTGLQLTLFYER